MQHDSIHHSNPSDPSSETFLGIKIMVLLGKWKSLPLPWLFNEVNSIPRRNATVCMFPFLGTSDLDLSCNQDSGYLRKALGYLKPWGGGALHLYWIFNEINSTTKHIRNSIQHSIPRDSWSETFLGIKTQFQVNG